MPFALYIHYPFCRSRCPYCGFASSVVDADRSSFYCEMLLRELELRAAQQPWNNGELYSLYFGGGTPSLIPPEYLYRLLDVLKGHWDFPADIEITLEANPGTIDANGFANFHESGINRLSIGAQSFQASELESLGRTHTVEHIEEAVHHARAVGFDNVSLDLIYGLPGQTLASFENSVLEAIDLNVDHVSTYSLSIEKNTPFDKRVEQGIMPLPNPDFTAEQYLLLCRLMHQAGFQHYELTNFARDGKWSRHNFAYWQRKTYLGLGCSAHSFDCSRRFWNIRDIDAYIIALSNGRDPSSGEEILSVRNKIEEQVYLSLRTWEGVERSMLENVAGSSVINELVESGFLKIVDNQYMVCEEKWLLLDEIVINLLSDTHRPLS